MRCEKRTRRHIKTLAPMFSQLVEGLLLGKMANVESPDQSRKLDLIIGDSLTKMSVHIVDRKAIGRKIREGLKSNVVRDDDNKADNALTISLSVIQISEWILHSGCSYHMCPNREMFLKFKEFNGGVVYMGNDSTCKMMGIGSVQIKMFDGVV